MTETVTPLSETVSQIVRSRTCGCRDFYIAKSHRMMQQDMLRELR